MPASRVERGPRTLVPVTVEARARKLVEQNALAPSRAVKRGLVRVVDAETKAKIAAALKKLHPMD